VASAVTNALKAALVLGLASIGGWALVAAALAG